MSLLSLVVVLVVLGVFLWALETFIPMDANIKMLIRVVGVVIALLYVLNAFGVIGSMSGMRVPKI